MCVRVYVDTNRQTLTSFPHWLGPRYLAWNVTDPLGPCVIHIGQLDFYDAQQYDGSNLTLFSMKVVTRILAAVVFRRRRSTGTLIPPLDSGGSGCTCSTQHISRVHVRQMVECRHPQVQVRERNVLLTTVSCIIMESRQQRFLRARETVRQPKHDSINFLIG